MRELGRASDSPSSFFPDFFLFVLVFPGSVSIVCTVSFVYEYNYENNECSYRRRAKAAVIEYVNARCIVMLICLFVKKKIGSFRVSHRNWNVL